MALEGNPQNEIHVVSEILLTVERKTCCNNKGNNCTMLEIKKCIDPNTVPYNKSKESK